MACDSLLRAASVLVALLLPAWEPAADGIKGLTHTCTMLYVVILGQCTLFVMATVPLQDYMKELLQWIKGVPLIFIIIP